MNVSKPIAPSKHKVATLESLSEGLVAAIRSIPPHEQAVAEAPAIDARRPASSFLDPGVFKREQERIFRRLPMAVTVSAMLPEKGSVIAHDGYGVPLLLARGKDGVVRAFLNACQHKGAMLVEDCEHHKLARITCPYHAWTYGLDGALVGVPREETFKNLDKAERRLAELPCKEAGGIVWVILNRHAAPDFSLINADLSADLTSLGIGDMHLYGRQTFDLKANWKLVLEPFLEAYHVQRLHSKTVGPMFADVNGVHDLLGPHIRQISGRGDFAPEKLDRVGENIHKMVTITYQMFPCTVVIGSPYYLSVMIIIPTAVDRSQVDYFMLTQEPPNNAKAEELYSKSLDLILKVFGTEDFRAAEISQVGLAAGALDEVVYCGLEVNIPVWQKVLDSYLAE